jgi:hypothetical protein
VFITPLGREVVVIDSRAGAMLMVNAQLVAVAPVVSVTLMLKVPVTVGVPVTAPVELFSDKPFGSVPTTEYV